MWCALRVDRGRLWRRRLPVVSCCWSRGLTFTNRIYRPRRYCRRPWYPRRCQTNVGPFDAVPDQSPSDHVREPNVLFWPLFLTAAVLYLRPRERGLVSTDISLHLLLCHIPISTHRYLPTYQDLRTHCISIHIHLLTLIYSLTSTHAHAHIHPSTHIYPVSSIIHSFSIKMSDSCTRSTCTPGDAVPCTTENEAPGLSSTTQFTRFDLKARQGGGQVLHCLSWCDTSKRHT